MNKDDFFDKVHNQFPDKAVEVKTVDEVLDQAKESSFDQMPVKAEYTIIFSTDGKHSVIVKTSDGENLKAVYQKANTIYEYIVEQKGTKQAQAVKEYAKPASKETGEKCPKCGAPMKISSKGKPYCSATCWIQK